jgi:hypothetical protein
VRPGTVYGSILKKLEVMMEIKPEDTNFSDVPTARRISYA